MEDKATLYSNLQPSYHGIIVSANDGMILLEACIRGYISPLPCRPIKEERAQLPRRGNIFIYEERDTAIVRWLDGIIWTPRKKSDHCFLYRKVTFTRQKGAVEFKPSLTFKEGTRSSQDRISDATNTKSNGKLFPMNFDTARHDKLSQPMVDLEKSAAGLFMDDGVEGQLIKKTMRFKIGPQTYHLVSYYSAGDELGKGKLQIPSKDPKLSALRIRREIFGQIHEIPLGDDSQDFEVDEFSADMSYPRSPYNRMDDAGTPALDEYNFMDDAGMLAFDSYNPMGNAIMPAFDAYNPMGYASMPALGYDMRPGNGEDQDFEMPSTFSRNARPNSHRAPGQASFQQGPYPPTNPYM
ncbi:hypothetical protein VE02_00848 [Pseudogymnoascus sp. 03VT05]|nr:hypothetical protein VE02_00848 [Pseudogymnoascus sp. 03VT05]